MKDIQSQRLNIKLKTRKNKDKKRNISKKRYKKKTMRVKKVRIIKGGSSMINLTNVVFNKDDNISLFPYIPINGPHNSITISNSPLLTYIPNIDKIISLNIIGCNNVKSICYDYLIMIQFNDMHINSELLSQGIDKDIDNNLLKYGTTFTFNNCTFDLNCTMDLRKGNRSVTFYKCTNIPYIQNTVMYINIEGCKNVPLIHFNTFQNLELIYLSNNVYENDKVKEDMIKELNIATRRININTDLVENQFILFLHFGSSL